MGQIVCSTCNATVEYFDNEKVTVLYGICPQCGKEHKEQQDNE